MGPQMTPRRTPQSVSPSKSRASAATSARTIVNAVKTAGYDDAQVIEIVLHVALNTWTNYINEVAKTDIDFPVVTARERSLGPGAASIGGSFVRNPLAQTLEEG